MSPGQQLDKWLKWIEPIMGRITFAVVLKKIKRSEILEVADRMEEAAQQLRAIVGVKKDDSAEQCGTTDGLRGLPACEEVPGPGGELQRRDEPSGECAPGQ